MNCPKCNIPMREKTFDGVTFERCAVSWLPMCVGIALVLGWIGSAQADALDDIGRRGELVWGGDAEGGGPFVYPDDNDPELLRGFEVELADLLAARLGVRARFAQTQWDKLPDLLRRGDIDIVLNGYEWTANWSERFLTTVPYYVYELQMMVRVEEQQLVTLADLGRPVENRKRRIAVLGGSAAENFIRTQFGDAIDIVLYDGTTDAMRAVELSIDNVDATLQDLPIVEFYGSRFPQLRRLGEPVEPGFYTVLVRAGEERLVQALNDAILECYRDGSFPAVLKKYGLWNRTQQLRGLTTDARGNFQGLNAIDEDEVDHDGETHVEPTSNSLVSTLRRLPLLLQGAVITVLLAVFSMPLAIAVGLAVAIGRLYGPRWLASPLALYVEVIRGTPLVLQLYLIFFLLPELGVSLPAMLAAVLGLAMNYSAYEAEIYRAGLLAIPKGQMEAALSLGMTRAMALRRILVPQAVKIVIPPVTNDFIALFKDTAVCSVITVVELSKLYYIHARSTGAVVELGLVTAGLYLAMSYPLSVFVSSMERRLAKESR